MRFSQIANGSAIQTLEDKESLQEGWKIVDTLLRGCSLDPDKLDDAVVMDWIRYHWRSHFERQLEVSGLIPLEIATLFLKILNDTFEENFKERITQFDDSAVGKIRKVYHIKRIYPRESIIHANIKQVLMRHEEVIPTWEVS